jgi:two-component system phosphate regulon response regulator PhoB
VEDDPDLRVVLKLILEKGGYDVTSLESGTPIVNNQFECPDVFVLDKKMDIIDGFALCKYLKLNDRTKDIPVILISGSHEYSRKALQIGADYFMPKPLQIEELLSTIELLISRSAALIDQN